MWRVSSGAFHLVFSVSTVYQVPFLQHRLQSVVLTASFKAIHLKPTHFTAIHFVIGHFWKSEFQNRKLSAFAILLR